MAEAWHEIFRNITNNYRFVPLDRAPLKAPVRAPGQPVAESSADGSTAPADSFSRSSPLPGGMSGIIRADWIARTPVLFGTQRAARPPGLGQPVRVTEPQRLHGGPDAPYVIPGRALRGMIRQVLRIATKGKIGPFNDIRPTRRDPDYQAARVGRDGKLMRAPLTGWLVLTDGGWIIEPCDSRPENIPEGMARFSLLEKHRALQKYLARPQRDGRDHERDGWRVFSGPASGKQMDRAFSLPWGPPIKVSDEAFRTFFTAYSRPGRGGLVPDGSLEVWAYEYAFQVGIDRQRAVLDAFNLVSLTGWSKQRLDNPPGIPVYYYRIGESELVIGLTQVLRFPYKRAVGDAVIAAQPDAHAKWLDWTEAMLGRIDKDGDSTTALKGRVSFGFASAAQSKLWKDGAYLKSIQMQPRPGYFAFYLRRAEPDAGPATYDRANGIAAGRKRYPAWSEPPALSQQLMSWGTPPDAQDESPAGTDSYLRFLEPGTHFSSEIHFHNLLAEELGALLWALALGDEDAFSYSGASHGRLCHSGGRARGLSFGSLWPARISLEHVERNGPPTDSQTASGGSDQREVCNDCLRAFAEAAHGVGSLKALNQTPALSRLRRFCDPERNGVPIGLGLRDAKTKDVFLDYVALRRAIESATRPKVEENLAAPAASPGFNGNILDYGSDP